MKGKSLCLIVPSLVGGGMERIISLLANYTVDKGMKVHLLLMYRDDIFYRLDPRITVIQPSITKKSNFAYAFYLFPYLRYHIHKINPDAVLSFGERYNSYVLLAALGLKVPIFVSDRSSPNKKLGAINYWLSKILYKKAAGIIAQTTQAAVSMRKRLKGKYSNIRVIPNPLRPQEKLGGDKKNQIVALGRLVREKRYDRLIKIMAKLENKSWKLVIVGGGDLKTQIETQIDELNLNDRVILVGQQKEVDPFLEESKIYVLTSDTEGYPNALCEAMSFGLASVSFDCIAGPSDIIDNGVNGILVEDGDIDCFAKELDILINNEQKRIDLGCQAEKIQERLSGDKIFTKYLQFIFGDQLKKIMQ